MHSRLLHQEGVDGFDCIERVALKVHENESRHTTRCTRFMHAVDPAMTRNAPNRRNIYEWRRAESTHTAYVMRGFVCGDDPHEWRVSRGTAAGMLSFYLMFSAGGP